MIKGVRTGKSQTGEGNLESHTLGSGSADSDLTSFFFRRKSTFSPVYLCSSTVWVLIPRQPSALGVLKRRLVKVAQTSYERLFLGVVIGKSRFLFCVLCFVFCVWNGRFVEGWVWGGGLNGCEIDEGGEKQSRSTRRSIRKMNCYFLP